MVTETAAAVGAVAGGMVGRIGTGVGAVIVQALRLPLAPLPPCTSSRATQRRTQLRRACTCRGLRPHITRRASPWVDPKVVACDCVCRLLRLLCVVLQCVVEVRVWGCVGRLRFVRVWAGARVAAHTLQAAVSYVSPILLLCFSCAKLSPMSCLLMRHLVKAAF